MTFEEFADALSRCESNNDDRAYGDEGLALGRWQMHPAFFHDYMPRKWLVDSSWRDMFKQCLEVFWNEHDGAKADPIKFAMMFHLGVAAVLDEGRWDAAYAERFQKCLASK